MELRTSQQNKALHLYYDLVASSLNDAGLDMRKVLKPTVDIPWTKESVKEHLWRPVQKAMYGSTSTTKLTAEQVTKVYETVNRFLAEHHGISEPFPSLEEIAFELLVKEQTDDPRKHEDEDRRA